MPTLRVRLIMARDLDLISVYAYQQPTCYLQIDEAISTITCPTSSVLLNKDRNPVFGQVSEFRVDEPLNKKLYIAIVDQNEAKQGKTIGEIYISLLNLPLLFEVVSWYSLGTKTFSKVKVGLTALDFDTRKILPIFTPMFLPHQIVRNFPHIAKGSFGVVFTGRVQGINGTVVIKDVDIHNQRNIENWKKEISMMSSTRCPYIVEILGYSSSDQMLTIIMEYMKRGSLYDLLYIRKERVSLLQRMRMARQCALGLAYMHGAGIIHRDVKSMNILVSEDYSCKLTDFGCAKLISGSVFNTANSGTPLWMAPEVKLGKYDFSADIYSLGLVFYEIFEGRLPQYDTLRQIVILPPKFQLSELILMCISPNPMMRPTATAIVTALDDIIRNIVSKLSEMLTLAEKTMIRAGLGMDVSSPSFGEIDAGGNFDLLLSAFYKHFLCKDPDQVDEMIRIQFSTLERANVNVASRHYEIHPGHYRMYAARQFPMSPPSFGANGASVQNVPPMWPLSPSQVQFKFYNLPTMHFDADVASAQKMPPVRLMPSTQVQFKPHDLSSYRY